MSISKIDFFSAYPNFETKQPIKGKLRSLSKEIYLLKTLIAKEKDLSDKAHLYRIAVRIYSKRHKNTSCCNRIKSLFCNLFSGRGFHTTEFFFSQIKKVGKKHHFNKKLLLRKAIPSETSEIISQNHSSETKNEQNKSKTVNKSVSLNDSGSSSTKSKVDDLSLKYGSLSLEEIEEKGKSEIFAIFDAKVIFDEDLEKIYWFFENFNQKEMTALIKGLFSSNQSQSVFINFLMGMGTLSAKKQFENTNILIFELFQMKQLSYYLQLIENANKHELQAVNNFVVHYINVAISTRNTKAGELLLSMLWKASPGTMISVIEENFDLLTSKKSKLFSGWLATYMPAIFQAKTNQMEHLA